MNTVMLLITALRLPLCLRDRRKVVHECAALEKKQAIHCQRLLSNRANPKQ